MTEQYIRNNFIDIKKYANVIENRLDDDITIEDLINDNIERLLKVLKIYLNDTVKYYEDTVIKYTSAIWLRPNGESVDGVGITPDYDVSNVIKNNALEDKQFDKALQLFN